MNELIAMYALSFVLESTEDGQERARELLTDEEIDLFAQWSESQTISGDDIFEAIISVIKKKVVEIKQMKGE